MLRPAPARISPYQLFLTTPHANRRNQRNNARSPSERRLAVTRINGRSPLRQPFLTELSEHHFFHKMRSPLHFAAFCRRTRSINRSTVGNGRGRSLQQGTTGVQPKPSMLSDGTNQPPRTIPIPGDASHNYHHGKSPFLEMFCHVWYPNFSQLTCCHDHHNVLLSEGY